MLSRLRSINWLRRPWKPLVFDNTSFTRLPANYIVEEENMPYYATAGYYPTRIGEIFQHRYQVVAKLGYGLTSTVWLARDMQCRRYVTLKIYIKSAIMAHTLDNELAIYDRIRNATRYHPGRVSVRMLQDTFKIDGPEDYHRCLVHTPLFESVMIFLHRNPIQRLPKIMVAFILHRVLLALDYLHTKCQVIHTDIKADNIMFENLNESINVSLEQCELQAPCPRKELDGRCIYTSQQLVISGKSVGAPVLCDFGSAVLGGEPHLEYVQPNIYRAPEVILEVPWTYSVDIWNVGCMIWDIFQGDSLFTGKDPERQTYRRRAHLAEMIALLGPPPSHFLAAAQLRDKFFAPDGAFLAPHLISTEKKTLEQRETTLEGEADRADFLRFMRRMLQWEPEKRSSARDLAFDDWIVSIIKR